MFPIAGQTAGPNGLTFFEGTHEYPGGNIGKKIQKFEFFKNRNIFSSNIFYYSTGNAGPFSE